MLSRVAAHSVHGLISGGGITPNEATRPIIYDDIRRALSSLVTILVGTLLYLPAGYTKICLNWRIVQKSSSVAVNGVCVFTQQDTL